MNVLIWQAYGNTDIYCVESEKQLMSIFDQAVGILKQQYSPTDLKKVKEIELDFEILKNLPMPPLKSMKGLILELYKFAGDDNDSFEVFRFTKVRYE